MKTDFSYSSSPFLYVNSQTYNLFIKQTGIQKKAWSPTVVVPRSEAFALPLTGEQQREAHANTRRCAISEENDRHKYIPIERVAMRIGNSHTHTFKRREPRRLP